jgi:hypothetical protein
VTKLTPAHLKPLVTAIDQAMREGRITKSEVLAFIYEVDLAVLELRVAQRLPPEVRPNKNGARSTTS